MSVALCIGIRAAYESPEWGERLLVAVNEALFAHGQPAYLEPDELPEPRDDGTIGRADRDELPPMELVRIGLADTPQSKTLPPRALPPNKRSAAADEAVITVQLRKAAKLRTVASHRALLAYNPFRVVYVPLPIPKPLRTHHKEPIAGLDVPVWIGSSLALLAELQSLRPSWSQLATVDIVSGERPPDETAWLTCTEAARVAIKHKAALVFSG